MRSIGGCWCRKELFANRLWRLCDLAQQLGAPSSRGRLSPRSHPVREQLSGLRHPPGRASTQLHSSEVRSDAPTLGTHPAMASWTLHGVPLERPWGSSQSHLPMSPKHTCRNAPLCSQGTGHLRMSSAAKFTRQGLRPLCKVVSSFTGRASERESFFLLKRERISLSCHRTPLLQTKINSQKNKNKAMSVRPCCLFCSWLRSLQQTLQRDEGHSL